MNPKLYKNKTNIKLNLYTNSGLLVATGFDRIVFGKRGPYIEFSTQILNNNLYIPKECNYRLTDSRVYYFEYRTKDICHIKVYFQKKRVRYADYKIGYWYISPDDVVSKEDKTLEERLMEV